MTIPQTLFNHPPWDSSDPDMKSEELLWGRYRVETRWNSFILSAVFLAILTVRLVRLRLKHRGNVFFWLGW